MKMVFWRKIKGLLGQEQEQSPSQKREPLRIQEQENRFSIRKLQRRTPAFFWSNGMGFPKQCSIHDVSMVGACIDLGGDAVKAYALGGTLTLYFPAEDQEIDCQVAWRSGSRVGVQFTGSYRAPTRRDSA